MKYPYWIYLALLICFLLPSSTFAQSVAADKLVLIDVDGTTAPTINLHFGFFDQQGQPKSDLVADDLQVIVDSKPLTTTPQLVVETRSPAVTIVADISAAMADQSIPGQTRLDAMIEQIEQFVRLLPNDSLLNLVVFADQAKIEREWQVGADKLHETLIAFKSKGLPAPAENTPYALNDAITLGMQQLASTNHLIAGHPRALVAFAAGVPNQSIDTSTLANTLNGLQMNLPMITIVGMAGNAAGQFVAQPGNPDALNQIAAALPNARFLPFFSADVNQAQLLRNDLDARYRALANSSQIYSLSFDAGTITAGVHTIEIRVQGTNISTSMQIPLLPPVINLQVPNLSIRDGDHVGIDVRYQQRPVAQVEYFLDGQSIGVATTGPEFSYTIDTTKPPAKSAPQADQPTSERHELSAIATDVDGRQSTRSSQSVTIIHPSQSSWFWPALVVVLLGILLLMVGGAIVFVRTNRAPSGIPGVPTTLPANPFGGLTEVVPSPNGSRLELQGITEAVTLASNKPTLRVSILEGSDPQEFELKGARTWAMGRDPAHAISIKSNQVSSTHAELALTAHGVKLTALKTTNGTFIGEEKQPIAPGQSRQIRFGEVFWLGPTIKLKVERR